MIWIFSMDVRKINLALLLLGACSLVLAVPGSAQTDQGQGTSEEVLKGRVEQFYTLLLSNRMADAEAYVTQDSIENFRRLKNNQFVGFQVEAVHLDADGTSAEVETTIFFVQPPVPQPIPFRRKSNWRLENGEWRFFLPIVTAQNSAEKYVPGGPLPKGKVDPSPPKLRFDKKQVDLGVIYTDDKPKIHFSFTNISDSPIRIEVQTGCDCLQAMKDDKTYGPGDSGEVVIEFDPAGYLFFYKQTIIVKTEPDGHRHLLLINAKILPAEQRPTR